MQPCVVNYRGSWLWPVWLAKYHGVFLCYSVLVYCMNNCTKESIFKKTDWSSVLGRGWHLSSAKGFFSYVELWRKLKNSLLRWCLHLQWRINQEKHSLDFWFRLDVKPSVWGQRLCQFGCLSLGDAEFPSLSFREADLGLGQSRQGVLLHIRYLGVSKMNEPLAPDLLQTNPGRQQKSSDWHLLNLPRSMQNKPGSVLLAGSFCQKKNLEIHSEFFFFDLMNVYIFWLNATFVRSLHL